MSAQSTSHDPHTDRRSILVLIGLAMLTVVCLAGMLGAFNVQTKAPEKAYTIDGCDIYRFTENGDKNFFARCDNGKVATTYADGTKNITTEPKGK